MLSGNNFQSQGHSAPQTGKQGAAPVETGKHVTDSGESEIQTGLGAKQRDRTVKQRSF